MCKLICIIDKVQNKAVLIIKQTLFSTIERNFIKMLLLSNTMINVKILLNYKITCMQSKTCMLFIVNICNLSKYIIFNQKKDFNYCQVIARPTQIRKLSRIYCFSYLSLSFVIILINLVSSLNLM